MKTRKKFINTTLCLAVFTSKCLANMFIETFQQKYSNVLGLHIDADSQEKKFYYVLDLDCKNE